MAAPTLDDLPPAWRAAVDPSSIVVETAGMSGADVWRMVGIDGTALIVKSDEGGPSTRIAAEGWRLAWLAQAGIAVPRVVGILCEGGRDWLMMTALQGQQAADSGLLPTRIVTTFARTLARLHRVPSASCPFDMRLAQRLDDASARIEAGHVTDGEIDPGLAMGRSARELLDYLRATASPEDDLVVTHGDACLENIIMFADGRLSGLIDVGRAGIAPRGQDLALAARSVREHFGVEAEALFWTAYGISPLPSEQLAYFELLEELG